MTSAERKVLDLIEDSDLTLCIEWPHVYPNGYAYGWGRGRDRKNWRAHRVAFRVWNGELSDEQHVHHVCGTKSCINPLHLRALNPRDHMLHHALKGDSVVAVMARRTSCPQGHSYSHVDARGHRHCRPCEAAASRRYRAARRTHP